MPQLQVDFFIGEFMWLFFFFVLTYVMLKYYFLAEVLSIYKVRSYIIQKVSNKEEFLQNKKASISSRFFSSAVEVYRESTNLFGARL